MSTNESAPSNGKSLVLMIVGIVLAIALMIFWNIRQMQRGKESAGQQLPVIAHLNEPLEGVNHRGEKVFFADLRGKVWVLAYVFTRCNAGCAGVMGKMKELQDEFAGEENLHFVAVSMDPENDTPEHLAAWGSERGMGEGNWWFFTGDTKEIRNYMSKHFKMNVTEGKDLAGDDTLLHEFKLVLIDQAGTIRYYYDPLGGPTEEAHAAKIRQDIRYLLKQ